MTIHDSNTRMRWFSILATGALAIAVFYHALSVRYEVRPLAGFSVTRTDRLTGHIDFCTASRSGPMVCRPAEN